MINLVPFLLQFVLFCAITILRDKMQTMNEHQYWISYAWSGVISFIAEGHIIFLLWPGKNQLDFWLFMNFCGAAAGYLSGKLSVYLKIKKGENK
ncbi:MAG: hypothetical protein WC422_04260 [Candidatus Paceibacterota bacterium]|jgi:hypothetical protein